MDYRILSLQKWNMPRTKTLEDVLHAKRNDSINLYASFQSVNFVEIRPISLPSDWKKAKDILNCVRADAEKNNAHICQSALLYSDSGAFWAQEHDVLFTTFFKLSDYYPIRVPHLVKKIQQILTSNSILNDQYSMYYSHDFCDIVLFVADVGISLLHKVLWDIVFTTTQRDATGKVGRVIKTSATVLAFGKQFVYNNDVKNPEPNNPFSFEINLEVQDIAQYNKIKNSLMQNGLISTISQGKLLERRDIRFLGSSRNYSDFIKLVRCLENRFETPNDSQVARIPNYDIKIVSTGDVSEPYRATLQNRDDLLRSFTSYITKNTKELECNNIANILGLESAISRLVEYGFSDEIGLSIIEALAGYYIVLNQHYKDANLSEQQEFSGRFSDAVSAIVHSLMHGEQEFLQAPSLQLPCFIVPPKILALYTAVAHYATKALLHVDVNPDSQRVWFLVNPNLKNNVHGSRLSHHTRKESAVSVIYLDEGCFYHPSIAIPAVCHEIAHQVGERHRKERAKLILSAVSGYFISSYLDLTEDSIRLFLLLSEQMGTVVFDELHKWITLHKSTQEYYLCDILDYMASTNNLTDYFISLNQHSSVCDRIVNSWAGSLKSDRRLADIFIKYTCAHTRFKKYIECLKKEGLESTINSCARIWICTIQQIITRRLFTNDGDGTNANRTSINLQKFVKNVTSAFSEVYADLKMAELTGMVSSEQYNKVILSLSPFENESNCWRKSIIVSLLDGKSISDECLTKNDCSGYVLLYLEKYIKICRGKTTRRVSYIKKAQNSFSYEPATNQFALTRQLLYEYRRELVDNVLSSSAKETIKPSEEVT